VKKKWHFLGLANFFKDVFRVCERRAKWYDWILFSNYLSTTFIVLWNAKN